MNNNALYALVFTLALAPLQQAAAKVSPEEAAELGKSLTPIGADPKANADGSIPAYTGSMLGLPEGLA
ncbi:MAG: hypothetical protein R3228_14480, partial [Halioglobus sp.]|nr:hypothetical protein [Halioglobus sp.]